MAGIFAKYDKLDAYGTSLSTHGDKVTAEAGTMSALMKALPQEAWKDPEEKAFLETFDQFNKDAATLATEIAQHSKFAKECATDYSNAQKKALSRIPQ